HRLYPLLHLTAHTGMRRGEVVGLKWSDLDRDGQRLSIQRTLPCVGGRPVEIGVKTRTSRRCIDLDATTLDELEQWRQRLAVEGHTQTPGEWMFRNERGRHLSPRPPASSSHESSPARHFPAFGSATCATPTRRYSSRPESRSRS